MKILVTGVAGFIGFFVSEKLLKKGITVLGIDNLCDYYSVDLKKNRLSKLKEYPDFAFLNLDLADKAGISNLFQYEKFDRVIHLGAQAGVRYSIDNPHAYADSNLIGHLNILEGCRQ